MEDPEAFSGHARVVTAMADAVAEMAGIPAELITITVSNGDGAKQGYGQEAEESTGRSVTVFTIDVPEGKPFAEVSEDFDALDAAGAIEIINTALTTANVTLPTILNVTITPPGTVHAPQAGFCMLGYQLYDGVLSDSFGECEGSLQEGTCILAIAEATKLCEETPRCAGLVDTTDAVWLARHPEGVAGVGGLPLSQNTLWKSCIKASKAAAADVSPEELCSAMNGTTACDSGVLLGDAADRVGNTSKQCCLGGVLPA
jgi:hypothetical protein